MFRLEEAKYCSRCILQEGWGTILSEEDGLCPACQGKTNETSFDGLNRLIQNVTDFKNYAKQNKDKDNFDCILMLSGGKDSIYMLYKLVNIEKFNPLAFTFNNPFESVHAVHNIEKTIEKLDVCHIGYTPNLSAYKELLKHTFNLSAEEIASKGQNEIPEKIPCGLCTIYMILITILFAKKMEIPYILYCADPGQMRIVPVDIKETIDYFKKYCGEVLVHKLFGRQLDDLLINNPDQLPKIVFPYLVEQYSPGEIIAEVKKLGLYETSPTETHCRLFGLLQYFSIKNFNRYFYALEIADMIRKEGSNREKFIYGINLFKKYIMQVAADENVSDELKANIKGLLKKLYTSDSAVEYVYNNILNIGNISKELGIKLN